MAPKTLKILFVAAEADPFIKVGGLGDVAGSLPLALRSLNDEGWQGDTIDIRLVIPLHPAIDRQKWGITSLVKFTIPGPYGAIPVEVLTCEFKGLPVYFVDAEPIQLAPSVYSLDTRQDGLKFTLFSLAVLEMTRHIPWVPDILHANDWHTAASVYILSLKRRSDPYFAHIKSVLSLHNLPFMGNGVQDALIAFGIPPLYAAGLPEWASLLPLPMGLATADAVVAVSQHYAQEIMTPEFGCDLQEFLKTRQEHISGIVNGLDTKAWDPATDSCIAKTFTIETLAHRLANKTALQKEFYLKTDPTLPLIILISRMDRQKGVDLAIEALQLLQDQPWQAILLGTGDPLLEKSCQLLADEFPSKVRAAIRFDSKLSHRMYAGADILLMPSRYEPCGLAQMIAMRYGCIPVARAVGGLFDTIQDGATGFLFSEASGPACAESLRRALAVYEKPDDWQKLQLLGMRQDFSWSASAVKYGELYTTLRES